MMTEVTTPNQTPALGAGTIPQMCPHVQPALPGIGFIVHKHKAWMREWREREREIWESGEVDTCPPETHIKNECTHKQRYAHTIMNTYVIQLLFFMGLV